MKRTTCSACGCGDLDQFLDLGLSPVADAYTATADEVSPTYPLQVAVCAKCHLVQLLEVLDGSELFGTGYSFFSSDSPPLRAYHAAYARDVLKRHGDLALKGLVEVGCNDGDLLQHFDPALSMGVDPSGGPASAAQDRGCDVLVRPFGLAAAHEIRDRRGRQGVVIANHVLAHVADVADVLAGISALLADDGIAMVEVQYLPDLLVNNAFDLVYHEHRNFFSLSSLEQAAGRHDLYVADAELTDRQGGSLRVTLRRFHKGKRRIRIESAVEAIRASETWLNSPAAYEGMQGRSERIRERLRNILSDEAAVGRTVAAYGAPAKATTLLNFCGPMGITKVIDPAPGKVGRHVPGVGLPIVAPDETMVDGNATLLLSAWNYAGPITRQYPELTANGGRWVIPFAAPVIL